MSTVKPPFTLPLMRPTIVALASSASSSSSHTMARLAFSRDSTVSPKPFSRESRATLTSSPMPTSISPASLRNCSIGTMPSDFRPALITTTSLVTATTMPLTMAPGFSLARLAWLCSNSSAKDSVATEFIENLWWIHRPAAGCGGPPWVWRRRRRRVAMCDGGWKTAGGRRPSTERFCDGGVAPARRRDGTRSPAPVRPRPRWAGRWCRCGRRRRPAAAAPPRGWHRGRRGRESPEADRQV